MRPQAVIRVLPCRIICHLTVEEPQIVVLASGAISGDSVSETVDSVVCPSIEVVKGLERTSPWPSLYAMPITLALPCAQLRTARRRGNEGKG